jgi:hypothetical protein
MKATDAHLSAAHHVEPRTQGCEECLRLGMDWELPPELLVDKGAAERWPAG